MVYVPPPPPPDDPLAFAPAVPRPRRDGWTPAVQTAFVAALAAGDSVAAAARGVRRSPQSAHALRHRPDAAAFAAAWDAAIAVVGAAATSHGLDRCQTGTVTPVVYRGRVVGERIVHDDRLLMEILRRTRPAGDPFVSVAQTMGESKCYV